MSSVLQVRHERQLEGRDAGGNRRRWTLVALALWLVSGVYLVQADQEAVVTTFGAVTNARVLPGLHYALPWPVDRVYKLKVHQQRRTVIGGNAADAILGRSQAAPSEFLSGDQNLLMMRVVVQYSVSDPRAFLFSTLDVDQIVESAVEAEVCRRIAHTGVDGILTTEKVALQADVLRASQRALDVYNTGVDLSSINVDGVSPPAEAADAFRDVAGARADAIRIVNQAQGYANDLIPRARGEAEQLRESAQAYKDGKINRASGDASHFMQVAAEYSKAPAVTSTRAYIEAMEQILPKLKKLIVDSGQNLDVTVVGREGVSKGVEKR
jgi:membrane protease subunit HflK